MLTKKLLAAVGLAGALLLGIAAPAEARGWGGGGFHRGPVYGGGFHRGPVYGGGFHRGPVYGGPVYVAPPVYRPLYRGVDWRRHQWQRAHGRFGYRY